MKPQKEMNSEPTSYDAFKWMMVLFLFSAGLFAHYHYSMEAMPLRMIAWIGLLIVILLIASQTTRGAQVLAFGKQSRNELRKVVWPGRPETVQLTLVVITIVLLTGFALWAMDSIILWLIGLLTGQRG